ncbi:unnamed protein product, partial [Closterium sp. NIES-53]
PIAPPPRTTRLSRAAPQPAQFLAPTGRTFPLPSPPLSQPSPPHSFPQPAYPGLPATPAPPLPPGPPASPAPPRSSPAPLAPTCFSRALFTRSRYSLQDEPYSGDI